MCMIFTFKRNLLRVPLIIVSLLIINKKEGKYATNMKNTIDSAFVDFGRVFSDMNISWSHCSSFSSYTEQDALNHMIQSEFTCSFTVDAQQWTPCYVSFSYCSSGTTSQRYFRSSPLCINIDMLLCENHKRSNNNSLYPVAVDKLSYSILFFLPAVTC